MNAPYYFQIPQERIDAIDGGECEFHSPGAHFSGPVAVGMTIEHERQRADGQDLSEKTGRVAILGSARFNGVPGKSYQVMPFHFTREMVEALKHKEGKLFSNSCALPIPQK